MSGNGKDLDFNDLYARGVPVKIVPPESKPGGRKADETALRLSGWAKMKECTDYFIPEVLDPNIELLDMQEITATEPMLSRIIGMKQAYKELRRKFIEWAG